jgi:hypothetical protein
LEGSGFGNGAVIGLTLKRFSLKDLTKNVMGRKKYRQKYRHLRK